ncbi:MAG: nuclear transport factor 2 family protein [Paracoccaceae bacterium]|nr:nuclear transport factor 2 family protein [Paracoccaceae bacterium]
MTPDIDTAKKLAEALCAAWTSHSPETVAERYAPTATFSINRGDAMTSRADIAEMAAGFMADFPDLVLKCGTVLVADRHMVYAWTLEGHHRDTGNFVAVSGWEEWDMDDDLMVTKSLGWYDAEDYERQVAG